MLSLFIFHIQAQKLSSPDKKLAFRFMLNTETPAYEVYFNNNKLVDKSPLSLEFLHEEYSPIT